MSVVTGWISVLVMVGTRRREEKVEVGERRDRAESGEGDGFL